MGMYLYLKENYPQIQTDVYLEEVPEVFHFIQDIDQAKQEWEDKAYDLFLGFRCQQYRSDRRCRPGIGDGEDDRVHRSSHHETKDLHRRIRSFRMQVPTCEVLYELMEPEKISKACAEALYTGIVHDTGVFQYSCTGTRTMEIAGQLMAKGIDFTSIIKDSFYTKSYAQNQIMGRTIMESIMLLDQRCIVGYVRQKDMDFYGVTPKDMDGIVNQLQNTRGVEVAIFLYEIGVQEYKVSMRSNGKVDVARVASYFGGGGHVKAAGCTMQGSVFDVVNSLTLDIERQLQE
jgi:phosphoesterase RecJ-like protein